MLRYLRVSASLSVVAATAAAVTIAGPAVAAAPQPPIPIGWPTVTSATQTDPIRIGPGVVTYTETYQTVDGPEQAQVLEVDLTSSGPRTGVVESHDHVIDPSNELTTSMGDRTGAEAGINGDYFNINATGQPLGGVVIGGRLVKSPRLDYQAQLAVDTNGTMHIGEIDFAGSLRDRGATEPLTSVNTVDDAGAGAITEITPDLGADASVATSTLVLGHRSAHGLVVDEVRPSVTAVPALAPRQLGLLGGGAGGAWLTGHVRRGDTVGISSRLSDRRAQALLSGATVLVRDGAVYTDPTGTPPSGRNPETMVGLSADGRHALLVVIDGRQPDLSIGVTPTEASEYLVAHGVDSGILLDGGGSSTLAARLPGTASLTIRNSPSDSTGERPVANGLFLYRH